MYTEPLGPISVAVRSNTVTAVLACQQNNTDMQWAYMHIGDVLGVAPCYRECWTNMTPYFANFRLLQEHIQLFCVAAREIRIETINGKNFNNKKEYMIKFWVIFIKSMSRLKFFCFSLNHLNWEGTSTRHCSWKKKYI